MKWLKKHSIAGLALVALLAACGSTNGASSTGTTSSQSQESESASHSHSANAVTVLNVAAAGELPTADSAKSYDTLSSEQVQWFQEGLYQLDRDNQPKPLLATDLPEISEDGLTYTIKLRQDAKWSNGDPVTAHDFVFAWRRVLDPDTAAQNASLFYVLANGQKANEGKASLDEVGVKALDDYTLEVTLAYADSAFTASLASVNWFPQNEKFVTEKGEAYGTNSDNVLGNGPFIMKNWDGSGISWSYEKNPNYWDADNIHFQTVNVQVVKEVQTGVNLFETDGLDVASISGDYVSQYKDSAAYVSIKSLRATNLELGISSNPDLQNENLRKALQYAVDRDALATSVLADGSVAATGAIPDGIAYNPETGKSLAEDSPNLLVTDKEKALEYFEKAKKELGKDTITLSLITSDTDSSKKIGEYLQGTYQQTLPGLTIELSSMPTKNRFEIMMSYDFDLALGGWTGEFDPATYLYQFEGGYEHNHGKFVDQTYDGYLNNIRKVYNTDPAKRYQELITAQEYLLDKAVVIPLFQASSNYLIDENLKGITTHTLGTPLDLTRSYFE